MNRTTVTSELLHGLVTGSHAEGTVDLAVAAAVEHRDQMLFIAAQTSDFDPCWELPTGRVLPGQTLPDSLHHTLALIGLDLDEVTGYLGHHDHVEGSEVVRIFAFSVTVTDPTRICQNPTIGHLWADVEDDLPDDLTSTGRQLLEPAIWDPPRTPPNHEPPLAEPLRAGARGLCADEASVELVIGHAVFLRRDDFCDPFIDTSITDGTELAATDWPAAINALDAGELPCSGGEERMLRLAASLADGPPVSLRDVLTGIDAQSIKLVIRAVLHTAGQRPSPEVP
jgi:hypothetical protein